MITVHFVIREELRQEKLVRTIMGELGLRVYPLDPSGQATACTTPLFVQKEPLLRTNRRGIKCKRRSSFLRVGRLTSVLQDVRVPHPEWIAQASACVALRELTDKEQNDPETLARLRNALFEASRVCRKLAGADLDTALHQAASIKRAALTNARKR